MATLTENLITWLKADPALDPYHVGEVVPQSTRTPYVWLQQADQQPAEGLEYCGDDVVAYDFECVSPDIAESRTITDAVKKRLRAIPVRDQPTFGGEVQFADVSNHDDDYLPRSQLDADARLFSGNLFVEIYLLEVVS